MYLYILLKKMEHKDSEIVDSENFRGSSIEILSRQQLVMIAIKRCMEAGSKEMVAGYYNEKTDKFGNITKTYMEDTRKVFIESVESLKGLMIPDIETDFKKELKDLKEGLDGKFKEAYSREINSWSNLNNIQKRRRTNNGLFFEIGCLNPHLKYHQEYMQDYVIIYRKIFEILINIVDTSDNYKEGSLST